MEQVSAIQKYYKGRFVDRLLELKKQIDAATDTFLASDRSEESYRTLVDTAFPAVNKFRENTRLHVMVWAKNAVPLDLLFSHDVLVQAIDNPLFTKMIEIVQKAKKENGEG